ncbi:hypothetical protein [Methylopila sp. M107]|uniref:hypothetical protein n=1 Tax=Methylopila sp. M107 TaxID=1101190 RepID=UPI00037783BA|nr:hypothetical protein [Methylopila sp. M107]
MEELTRRFMFKAAAAAAVGFVVVGANRLACRFVPRNHPDFFSLLDLAPADEASLRIGRLELARAGAPTDASGLWSALRAKPLIAQAATTSCARTRAELVQMQCASDFAEARVVELDGWLLSETEAAICAGRVLVAEA